MTRGVSVLRLSLSMEGFFRSFVPIFGKYKIEVLLLVLSFATTVVAIFLFAYDGKSTDANDIVIEKKPQTQTVSSPIAVDVSGAVQKPGVYKVAYGTRLKTVLDLAGGLSIGADQKFFERNFNRARILSDQEKIYIPFQSEIQQGVYTNNTTSPDPQNQKINVNTATQAELEALPGVGEVTAEKIIENRPYSSVEELLEKKIVKKNVYEEIKELVTIE